MDTILVGLLVGFFGAMIFERSKRKSAESALENLESKKEQNDLDKENSKNLGLLEAEETKRKEIKNEESKVSLQDVADFINNRDKLN